MRTSRAAHAKAREKRPLTHRSLSPTADPTPQLLHMSAPASDATASAAAAAPAPAATAPAASVPCDASGKPLTGTALAAYGAPPGQGTCREHLHTRKIAPSHPRSASDPCSFASLFPLLCFALLWILVSSVLLLVCCCVPSLLLSPRVLLRAGFTLINGNIVAKALRAEMKSEVDAMRAALGPDVSGTEGLPTLAVVLVGLRKDSQMYVHMKTKACAEVGVNASQYDLPAETSQDVLLELVAKLNADVNTNGILVQLPLPDHLDADAILAAIDPAKDVDGLTAANAGDLLRNGHKARLIPCTPLGCLALLDHYKFEISGKHAVVVGRSALVGKPVAQLLLSRDATVTMCHSKTPDLEAQVRQADIVVAAIGRASTLKGHWFKQGAIVLDVGTNAVDDPTKRAGYRLVGDVEFEAAKMGGQVKALTPVPGGVGPMTVTMLLRNTIRAFEQQKADKAKKQAQAAAKAAEKQ